MFALVFAPGSAVEHDDPSASVVSAAVLAPTADADADGLAAVPPDAADWLVVLPLALAIVMGARRSWRLVPLAVRRGSPQAVPASISRRGPPVFVA